MTRCDGKKGTRQDGLECSLGSADDTPGNNNLQGIYHLQSVFIWIAH